LTRDVRPGGIENLAEPSFCTRLRTAGLTGRAVVSAIVPLQRTLPAQRRPIAATPRRDTAIARPAISTGGRSRVLENGAGGDELIAGGGSSTFTVVAFEPLRPLELETVSLAVWSPGPAKAC
jgi:hypothetical protein